MQKNKVFPARDNSPHDSERAIMEDSGFGNKIDSMYIRGYHPDGKTIYASKAAIQLFKALDESEERRQKLKRIRLKHGLDKE